MQKGEGASVRERDGGAGETEAGCGAGITKAAENGFKQDSGDPTRAIGSAWNPFPKLRQGCA
ncbi:hypothetical protein [Enterocloster sp.]|uniref:hypothetical protein n=1 Tax=Enterocloster sp. TaxID=2719315 RepID=UPI0039A1C4CF